MLPKFLSFFGELQDGHQEMAAHANLPADLQLAGPNGRICYSALFRRSPEALVGSSQQTSVGSINDVP